MKSSGVTNDPNVTIDLHKKYLGLDEFKPNYVNLGMKSSSISRRMYIIATKILSILTIVFAPSIFRHFNNKLTDLAYQIIKKDNLNLLKYHFPEFDFSETLIIKMCNDGLIKPGKHLTTHDLRQIERYIKPPGSEKNSDIKKPLLKDSDTKLDIFDSRMHSQENLEIQNPSLEAPALLEKDQEKKMTVQELRNKIEILKERKISAEEKISICSKEIDKMSTDLSELESQTSKIYSDFFNQYQDSDLDLDGLTNLKKEVEELLKEFEKNQIHLESDHIDEREFNTLFNNSSEILKKLGHLQQKLRCGEQIKAKTIEIEKISKSLTTSKEERTSLEKDVSVINNQLISLEDQLKNSSQGRFAKVISLCKRLINKIY